MEPLCARQGGGEGWGDNIYISEVSGDKSFSFSPSEQVEPGEDGGVKHLALAKHTTASRPSFPPRAVSDRMKYRSRRNIQPEQKDRREREGILTTLTKEAKIKK